jgi:hypothetical protein
MGSIAINAAIIDCSTVESFQTKLRIDQTSKKSWARNMFRKVIPLLNSKKSQSVNEAHIFGEIDGDSTEKSRLACLYFHDKWTAVSEKNSGKEYDLKEHGIGLTNIGKIIKSMNIKRVAKFSTP